MSCLPSRYLSSPLPSVILKVAGSNLNHDRLYFLYFQEILLHSVASIAVSNSRHCVVPSHFIYCLPPYLSVRIMAGKMSILSKDNCVSSTTVQANSPIETFIMAWQRDFIFLSRGSPSARRLKCVTLNKQRLSQILTYSLNKNLYKINSV